MTSEELMDCRQRSNALLYKIVSGCNDACDFCMEYAKMENATGGLSFTEIKDNYEFFKDKLDIEYIVLSGGEPTLHPDIFKIIDYFKAKGAAFRVITNILKFEDNVFLSKAVKSFRGFRSRPQKRLSTLILSVNDLPTRNQAAFKRIEGLKKAMAGRLPLMITVVVYKDNLKSLPDIASMLASFFRKDRFYKGLYVELRMAYIKDIEPGLFKKYAPDNFLQVKESIEKALSILSRAGISPALWNFPLCYLTDLNYASKVDMRHRLKRRYIKISKDMQLDNAGVRNWESYMKGHNECSLCRFSPRCGGMERDYVEKLGFPEVKRL